MIDSEAFSNKFSVVKIGVGTAENTTTTIAANGFPTAANPVVKSKQGGRARLNLNDQGRIKIKEIK